MSSSYIQCIFDSKEEILIAFLSEYDFESFEELENSTIGYFKRENLTNEVKQEIENLLSAHKVTYEWKDIEDKNWNEVWESNFSPIHINDNIVVRAEFHPKPINIKYDIVINPKMAFGTGHHATTYMMLENMLKLDLQGKTVFDYGCGTGILAIFASMREALAITAVDVENQSFENTVENAVINKVKNIAAYQGTILTVMGQKFDTVLANINRNVLLDSVEQISSLINKNGDLLLSGILVQDFDIIHEAYSYHNFSLHKKSEREGWLCLHYIKILEGIEVKH